MTGKTISHYNILEILGEGGMGVVYKAEDARLKREVAIKFLPRQISASVEERKRFKIEAQAAAALNHPNIATIHAIEEHDEEMFIVMEYIDGQELTEIISDRISVNSVVEIAIQIAEGLQTAHAKGITHRDIKSSNLMVIPNESADRVKIMDFGLAKISGGINVTKTGTTLGTVAYMSPEQARGENVDHRTDVWSFGVVLYEMLTGRLPFEGEYDQAVIYLICHQEPEPVAAIRADAPDMLQQIIAKALEKKAGDRYQSLNGMLIDLRRLKKQTSRISHQSLAKTPIQRVGQTAGGRASSAKNKRSSMFWIGGAAVLALIMAFAVMRFGSGPPDRAVIDFQRMEIKRLTATGDVWDAAISPDGKYVVQVRGEGDKNSLWLRQVETGSTVQIGPAEKFRYRWSTFSPSGDYVYFSKYVDAVGTFVLFKLPVLGGPAKRISSSEAVKGISFSPDGSEIVFIRSNRETGGEELVIASADGSRERILAKCPANVFMDFPAWSPTEAIIAVNKAVLQPALKLTVVIIDISNGEETTLAETDFTNRHGLSWLPDGGGLVTAARLPTNSNRQLWHIAWPSGKVQRITNDLHAYGGVSVTHDGQALVTVQSQMIADIWVQDQTRPFEARQVPGNLMHHDGGHGIAWTADDKILYTSDVNGNWDIYSMRPDGSGRRQLTTNEYNDFLPVAPSLNGKYIVFSSVDTAGQNIWRMNRDGGNLKQLTFGNLDARAAVSQDGMWVFYFSSAGLMKVSIYGGEPDKIIKQQGSDPMVSPDGKWIAYIHRDSETRRFLTCVIPFEGGPVAYEFERLPSPFGWNPDSKGISFVKKDDNGARNLWLQPLDGGKPTQITHFEGDEWLTFFDWSPDGKKLAVVRERTVEDAVLIRNFR